MLFPCSKLVFYLQFTEEIFLFSRFYKLNNEKTVCVWKYCSVSIAYISSCQCVNVTVRTVEQLNFKSMNFYLFLYLLIFSFIITILLLIIYNIYYIYNIIKQIENRDRCIYQNSSVQLFYCSPCPAQKDFFHIKPFIPSRN